MKRSQYTNRLFNAALTLAALVVFLGFVVVTVWGDGGLLKLIHLREIRHQVASNNEYLVKENLKIIQKIERLKKLSYMEQTARSQMGLTRKHETVYIVD